MTRSQTPPDSPETRIPPLGGRRPRRAAALSGLMALTMTTSLLTAGPALAQTPAESSPAQGEQAEQARVEPRAARQAQASTPDGSSAERAAASCWERSAASRWVMSWALRMAMAAGAASALSRTTSASVKARGRCSATSSTPVTSSPVRSGTPRMPPSRSWAATSSTPVACRTVSSVR